MRLPKFEYFEPQSVEEAVTILQNEPDAKVLAGGTDLLVNMKHGVESPPVMVNIKHLSDMKFMRHDNGDIRIGALTYLKELYMSSLVPEKLTGLVQAASTVGSYHHQVMGTLAGNICQQNRCKFFNQSRWWRSSRPTCYKAGGEICHVVNKKKICYSTYCGDVAPVLLVLNARLLTAGPDGSREIPLQEFFSGDGKAPLELNSREIVTEIVIPGDSLKGTSVYKKFANRESIDFPIVGAAFWVSEDKAEFRLAFTAVDRKPLRSQKVEAFLNSNSPDKNTIKEAAQMVTGEAKPVKTSVYSPSHKRKMMGLLFQRAAEELFGRTI